MWIFRGSIQKNVNFLEIQDSHCKSDLNSGHKLKKIDIINLAGGYNSFLEKPISNNLHIA